MPVMRGTGSSGVMRPAHVAGRHHQHQRQGGADAQRSAPPRATAHTAAASAASGASTSSTPRSTSRAPVRGSQTTFWTASEASLEQPISSRSAMKRPRNGAGHESQRGAQR